ncbi:MAG: hypothetical protein EA405_01840 [Rhodospirillales bacterium]|nr:MAG: hypothetical protein EA405_01840 [Rhodospirillales bacterium]
MHPADPGNGPAGSQPRRWRTLASVSRIRNVSFSTADHVLLLVLWAVSTPIFIAQLGDERFGVWVLINAVVGLGGVFSLGFGEATIRFVAKYRADGRDDLVHRVVETTFVLYLAAGIVFGAGVAAAASWLAVHALGVSATHAAEATAGLRLAGLALVVTSLLKVFESAINGFERFDLTARISMVARTGIIVANAAAALLGFGLIVLMTITVVGLAGQAVATYRVVMHRFLPELRLFRAPSREVTGDVVRFGAHSWLQITSGALSNTVDRFLVGALVSPAAAGVYAVCLQLAQQIHLLLVRALAFIMPAASGAAGSGDGGHALREAYSHGVCLTLALIGVIAIPLYVLAPQVLTVWIGPDFATDGTDTLRLLTIYFAIWGIGVAPFYLLNGAGLPGWNTAAGLVHGLVIVAVAALLLPKLGLEGAAWARLAALPTLALVLAAMHARVLRAGRLATALLVAGIGVLLALAALIEARTAGLIDARFGELLVAGPVLVLAGGLLSLVFVLLARRAA